MPKSAAVNFQIIELSCNVTCTQFELLALVTVLPEQGHPRSGGRPRRQIAPKSARLTACADVKQASSVQCICRIAINPGLVTWRGRPDFRRDVRPPHNPGSSEDSRGDATKRIDTRPNWLHSY